MHLFPWSEKEKRSGYRPERERGLGWTWSEQVTEPEPGLLPQTQLNREWGSTALYGDGHRPCIGCYCFCLDTFSWHILILDEAVNIAVSVAQRAEQMVSTETHMFFTPLELGEFPTCQSAHLHCLSYLHSTRKTETQGVYRCIPCPPGTYLTPDHQLKSIVPWWYTCRKVTCSCFFRRIKKTWKKPDKGKSWVDVFR